MDKRLPSQEEIWLKHYENGAKEKSNDIEVDKTLWEVIEEKIFEYEGIPAIDYYGRKIKRLEFRDMVYNWAKTFKAMGIEKGEIVPVFSTFTPSVAAMALALNAIGACPNFAKIGLTAEKYNKELIDGKFAIILSPLYNEEMNEFLGQERFKKVFIATPYDDMAGLKKTIVSGMSRLKDYKNKSVIPKDPKYVWYDEAYNIGNHYIGDLKPEFTKNSPAFITYSSGTTSNALKGTIATNESAISQMRQGKYADMGYEEGKVCLAQFPPTASTALNCLFLSPFYCGMILKMYPSPDYREFYKQVMESKPHFTISTGAVWREFFKEYESKSRKPSLDFLKVAVIGGDGATLEEIEWMNSILGKHSDHKTMHQGYGLSESFSVVTFDKPGLKFDEKPKNKVVATVGIPYPGMTVGIFGEDGKELGYNERGELYVKSRSNMLGYYHNPELTEKMYTEDKEWIKTGDICEIDEEGRIFLYGRENDYIEYGDNKKAYLFDIANNIKALFNGAVSDCIVRRYDDGTDTPKVLCHLVLKNQNKLDNPKDVLALERMFYIIDEYIESLYKGGVQVLGYKLHDEFKINPASLKTNRLILDKELDDFYINTGYNYENGYVFDLVDNKAKTLTKKLDSNN